jgi:hypothetical protein
LPFEKASENQKNQNRSNTMLLGEGTPFSQALSALNERKRNSGVIEYGFNIVLADKVRKRKLVRLATVHDFDLSLTQAQPIFCELLEIVRSRLKGATTPEWS